MLEPPHLSCPVAFGRAVKPHGNGHSSEPASSGNEDADSSSPQLGTKETVIRAPHAFDAPDVLTMFVGEMRQQAETLQATAAVLVAPKSAVSFPQVCWARVLSAGDCHSYAANVGRPLAC